MMEAQRARAKQFGNSTFIAGRTSGYAVGDKLIISANSETVKNSRKHALVSIGLALRDRDISDTIPLQWISKESEYESIQASLRCIKITQICKFKKLLVILESYVHGINVSSCEMYIYRMVTCIIISISYFLLRNRLWQYIGTKLTNSSELVGWMATQLSKSCFVAPILIATPNP